MFAASRGHIEIVKELLEHKADTNLQHSEGSTTLILAAGEDHTDHLTNCEGVQKNVSKVTAFRNIFV